MVHPRPSSPTTTILAFALLLFLFKKRNKVLLKVLFTLTMLFDEIDLDDIISIGAGDYRNARGYVWSSSDAEPL